MRRSSLLRYNLRVVMFNNWWILVFPVAVSQLTVFWNLISQKFTKPMPASTGELVSPLLAAFLSAHVLSAEYPSRVGAILASKPLNIGKVVMLRLLAVLALVWLLEAISLAAYFYGGEPYDVGMAFVASVPSVLFLALLATTFATLLRHPLAGFGIAALYWAMDLPSGPLLNPIGSLKSYSTMLSLSGPNLDGLAVHWYISKIVLLVGAFILYRINARQVFRLGVPATLRFRRRALGFACGLILVNLLSGATIKVVFGYQNRGKLFPNDGAWFRRQFAGYGPIPLAYLYGPAFRMYLGDVPSAWRLQQEGDADLLGDTPHHRRELQEVSEKMSGSIWAASSAELLARLTARNQITTEQRIAVFQSLIDRYPSSPYLEFAIREKAFAYDAVNRVDEARAIYEELLKRKPEGTYRAEAIRYIIENDRQHKDYAGMETWAKEWLSTAKLYEKPTIYAAIAESQKGRGDNAAARASASQAFNAIREYQQARATGALTGTTQQELKWDREVRDAESKAHSF